MNKLLSLKLVVLTKFKGRDLTKTYVNPIVFKITNIVLKRPGSELGVAYFENYFEQ